MGRPLLGAAAAALALTAGAASAGRPATSTLANVHPVRVCGTPRIRPDAPTAECDAWTLARSNGAYLHVSGAVVRRHTAVVPTASPNTGASPNASVVQPMWPDGIHNAYGLPTTTAGSASETVAIVDAYDDPNVESDLSQYDDFWGLDPFPTCASLSDPSCLAVVNQSGQTLHTGGAPSPGFDSDWSLEISLDVETVHTICQDCKIILVEAQSAGVDDLATATNEAAALGANVISNSYGIEEGTNGQQLGQSGFDTFAPAYRHTGVIVVASSGDGAFPGGTQFPADVNDVVAVGGTTLTSDKDTGAYVGESAWYDPGASPVSGAGSGCSAYESAQPWQATATGWAAAGCGTRRGVADVAADADVNSGLYVWNTVASTPCNTDPTAPGTTSLPSCWWVVGGTSLAAPVIAATYALAANPSTVANPDSLPYAHLRSLHDVKTGANGSCASTICRGAAGYDGPTGIGTPDGLLGFSIGTPAITSFAPADGHTGTTVTIAGSGFTQASAVTIGGNAVQSFTVDSDVQITAVAGAAATGPVVVTTPGGNTASAGDFAFAPTIASFTPDGGPTGTPLTITGTGFTGTSSVTIGGTAAASFTVVSDSTIAATVRAGTASGRITVGGPAGTATSAGFFFSTPTVTGFTPTSAGVHATVTVTGTNLVGATSVELAGTPCSFNVVSETTLTFTVPTAAGTGTVRVTTPGGTATSADTLTIAPQPTITGFAPASGSIGTPVSITGTNLLGTLGVRIGSIVAVPTSVTDTQVVFTVPPGADSGTLMILNPAGSATSAGTFVVSSSSPGSISGFDPASGPAGTTVTIAGSGFTGATAVMVGGTAASSFTVVSDGEITAVLAAGTHTGRIVVTTPGGSITSSTDFAFVAPPAVTSFTPSSGGAHATVTVTGTDLSGATSVTLGGTPCAFTVVSATTLTLTVPAGAPSGHIAVTTAGGTATSTGTFTVAAAPTITGFSPPGGGPIGTTVTITGTNLLGTVGVRIGSILAVPTSVSATEVVFTIPPGAASGPLTILNPAGSATSATDFIVTG